jgi:hypothetical protein
MHVSEILDLANLEKMLREKYIHASESPDGKLSIYNYTPKAQFEQVWGQETEICRGLVLENGTGNVIARAFRKFFNATPEDLKARAGQPFRAFDKMDGSLVIVFNYDNKTRLATRGSFVSDQAIAAGQYWAEHHSTVVVPRAETWCFEWVGPSNPIVLRYDEDELILLARVRTSTGRDVEADKNTVLYGPTGYISKKFPQAEEFNFDSLELPHRENTEGYVLLFPDGVRLKVKEAEYLALHARLFHLSTKTVWQSLSEGLNLRELYETLPDEYYNWVVKISDNLIKNKEEFVCGANEEFYKLKQQSTSRKEFALSAKISNYSSALFRLYDDRTIEDIARKSVEPKYERPLLEV